MEFADGLLRRMAATMRKKLVLAGGIAGLLILTLAVFDPFGLFGATQTPIPAVVELARSPSAPSLLNQ